MRSALLSIWRFWLLLGLQVIVESTPSLSRPLNPRQAQPTPELPGVWGTCGSKYGLQPADTSGAIECALSLGDIKDKTITVGINDEPRLLCSQDNAKIWISPFTNKATVPPQDTFTFKTIDVQNFTLKGALKCCDNKVSSTCSGWGILSEVPDRDDVLVSINNSDKPEPVSCNDTGDC
ncbi:hypothetical protein HD806DRAFT_377187 [Xylariaceae sp. AK1471]|nr:hypothetical protein HD806DRAFT_377187 [Xylariaceae sp. AK1471]